MNVVAPNPTAVVTRLPGTPTTPSQLDKILYRKIEAYLREHSWRQLAEEVKQFVQEQYKPAYRLVSEGQIEPDELEREIKSQIPSRAYIEQYSKGRPICYRYTNTLANFFDQKYILENHDPCQEYLLKMKN